MKRFRIAGVVVLMGAAIVALSVSAQDPDGGAGRGRPLAAYRPAVPGIHGLVTAGHPLAAMAGLQVLMKGGNAIDAAVAVGTTLNMMEPQMNGIGGNGFMTIFEKKTGKVYSLSMAGAAPMAIKGADMTPQTLDWGMNAGIVPGNFGGYVTALQRFGTMSLAEVTRLGNRLRRPRLSNRCFARHRHRAIEKQAQRIPDHRESVPPERPSAAAGRAVPQSRSRRYPPQSRRSGAIRS